NSDGCTDTATLLIDVYLDSFILIPNVFSPHSDNTNEVFNVLVEGADAIQVDIDDRWCLFMYGYSTLTGSWDGTKNCKDASEGTYYYVIKVVDSTSNEHVYTGHVTLER